METIEEAAEKYVNEHVNQRDNSDYSQDVKNENARFDEYDIQTAFFSGANWALENQWHDASKELPYKYSECFEENESNYTKDILCCSKKGIYYTDYMFKSRISKEWRWSQKNSYDCKYWMPIPNIPKELKLK
jgi:hypothetical protein